MNKYIYVLIFVSVFIAGQVYAQKIKITAHRGASGMAPENTIASVLKAAELKADYAEIDVQETKDSVLIVIHDGNFKRTTGVDKNVWETTYDEVEKLDAGSSFSEKFKGEHIPLFETILDSAKGRIMLNIELKDNGHQQKLAERVIAAVEKKRMSSQVIITSFNRALIKKVRAMDKNLKVGYIFSVYPPDEDVFKADIDILSMGYKLINEETVRKANESGKKILAWTVNKPEDMERLSKFRIHSIVTNYPDKLQEILKK